MSFIVRREEPLEASESIASGIRPVALAKRWTSVAFHAEPPAAGADLHRFGLEAVGTVRGPRPPEWTPGLSVSRRELTATGKPAGTGLLCGVFDAAASTSDEAATRLQSGWQDNPFRVALLLVCKHDPRFWCRPPEELSFAHLGLPQDVRGGSILGQVIRRLHRAPKPETSAWDTLGYFEMLPTHVAHVREHLGEQREKARAFDLCERAVELWLVKYLDGFHQTNWPPNG